MRGARGFTLIEVVVVVGIIAVIAMMAGVGLRSARRDASVGATAFDLVLRLQGLKMEALNEQRTMLAVLVNPAGEVSTACGALDDAKCLRLYVLSDPADDWSLAEFDPETPAEKAALRTREPLPAGLALDVAAAGTPVQAPFEAVVQLQERIKGSCDGGTCVAVRFEPSGEVRPEYAGTDRDPLAGIAVGLTSDLAAGGAGDRRAVVVSFPTGIVKSFAY